MKISLAGIMVGLVSVCLSVPYEFQPLLLGLGLILIILSIWLLCIVLVKEELGGEGNDQIKQRPSV